MKHFKPCWLLARQTCIYITIIYVVSTGVWGCRIRPVTSIFTNRSHIVEVKFSWGLNSFPRKAGVQAKVSWHIQVWNMGWNVLEHPKTPSVSKSPERPLLRPRLVLFNSRSKSIIFGPDICTWSAAATGQRRRWRRLKGDTSSPPNIGQNQFTIEISARHDTRNESHQLPTTVYSYDH